MGGQLGAEGKSIYDFEQIKESTEELDNKYNDEILSIPTKIKMSSTFLYMITHIMTLLQLLAIFALMDWFLIVCIMIGHAIGFMLYGFKRRRSYLYIYNPLGSIVQFAFES